MSVALSIEQLSLQTVPFANERLCKFDDIKVAITNTVITDVNLEQVAGTWHSDYAGRTWGELKPVQGTLNGDITNIAVVDQGLKRAIANLQALDQNPRYYESSDKKENWTFYLVDGKYYIMEGNNRTVIARYYFYVTGMPPIVKGVTIYEASWTNSSSEVLPSKTESFLTNLFRKLCH